VVRPIRLHTLRKRETEVHLELLTKDYSETYYTEDGTPVTSTPQDMDHCYYHGSIVDDSESMVSMSTCDGLSGYFRTAAQRYLIEPLSGGDDGDHAVLKYEDQTMHRDRVSVVLVCTLKHIASIPFQYKKMESNRGELRKRIFEVVNFVNMVYKPLNTFIALVGLEVWSDSDKISVTAPAGATLDAFTTWRNNDLVKTKPHDNAHLISGIDFEGSTVGLAFIGTLCSGHSAGVVQDHNPRAIAVGATLAHEMGHNLGMNHDDSSACACSGNSCVMAGALSWDIPKSFSSCSSLSYDQFLNNRNPECLLNKPDYRNVESTPVCGNGFLERGEECDCGSLEECTNPCCNSTSCTLTKGSECAAGECCEDCKIMASSTECRRKHDDCDLAEYCTGNSAVCPEDVFSVNGISCDRGRGYCRNGQCPQHHDQCVKMYGPSAEKATTYCYNQNTRGLYYAYCRRPSQDQFIPCCFYTQIVVLLI
uniref:ADAM metallopeptidase domain 28 n=1 Tax=Oncorhynchus mykiss TaxID=8022 RepID=A0A8C7QE41_ONCMY